MLVLTRRVGESVMIGHHITVTVLSVQGERVQLGTLAPKALAVHREEIYERVTANIDARAAVRHRGPLSRRVRKT